MCPYLFSYVPICPPFHVPLQQLCQQGREKWGRETSYFQKKNRLRRANNMEKVCVN